MQLTRKLYLEAGVLVASADDSVKLAVAFIQITNIFSATEDTGADKGHQD